MPCSPSSIGTKEKHSIMLSKDRCDKARRFNLNIRDIIISRFNLYIDSLEDGMPVMGVSPASNEVKKMTLKEIIKDVIDTYLENDDNYDLFIEQGKRFTDKQCELFVNHISELYGQPTTVNAIHKYVDEVYNNGM